MGAVNTALAVWDVREPDWWTGWRAKSDWARAQGIPVDDTHRIEFYLIDAPFARVFTYARDGQGRKHWNEHHTCRDSADHDHSRCDVARQPPYDLPLDALPPRELL